MKAQDYLRKGAELLEQRGKEYDKPEGERSMGKCVKAFNAITGRDLTESEGWLLLQVLKDVRQWQNPGRFHADSAEDCISYAALKAEALAADAEDAVMAVSVEASIKCSERMRSAVMEEPAAAIDDDSERQQRIQQSGELAEEVYAAVDGWVKWDGGQWSGARDVLIEVRRRDGTEHVGKASEDAEYWDWEHHGAYYDIIAYRICKD